MKLKKHVIMLSAFFPVTHPRKGEPTGFKDKLASGEKIHTIRANYAYWKKKIDEVNLGIAYLSIRQWSGQPYKSKQVEIATITGKHNISIQKVKVDIMSLNGKHIPIIGIENAKTFSNGTVIANDGLSEVDFCHWFKGKSLRNGGIIHFTEFTY